MGGLRLHAGRCGDPCTPQEFCPKTQTVNAPKNDSRGTIVMFDALRDRLLAWQRVCPRSEWVFPTAPYSRSTRGHFVPSTRSRYWDRLRVGCGLDHE